MTQAPVTAAAASARRHRLRFLQEFLIRPTTIGAVAPSSRHLARRMLDQVDFQRARVVVEFGPGTGAFTQHILRSLSPEARFFAIELNPTMARLWKKRYPGRSLHQGSASDVARFGLEEGLGLAGDARGTVDVIFSGLPWASFSDRVQTEVLSAARDVLRPGGVLVTFGYRVGTVLPAGRRFYSRLPRYFSSVTRSGYVWRNLPPAFVVRCVR